MEQVPQPYRKVIFVCVNERTPGEPACGSRRSGDLLRRLKDYVKSHGLKGKVRVASSGCLDLCALGPNIMVFPEAILYRKVSEADVDRIIAEHLSPLEGSNR